MYSHSRDGGDLLLQVLVVGHADLAVGADLEDPLHDGAHIEEGGRLGDARIGMNVFLSVFIHIIEPSHAIIVIRSRIRI